MNAQTAKIAPSLEFILVTRKQGKYLRDSGRTFWPRQ
jgi:hypothetical protein